MKGITFKPQDGSSLTIGIVKAEWNAPVTDALYQGCLEALAQAHIPKEKITTIFVPGSFELIAGARHLQAAAQFHAIICIGALIKGQTAHFDHIASAVANGLAALNTQNSTPVIFGVLTCLNAEQAIERSTGENNHGYGWGLSAVQMGLLGQSKK